MAQLFSVYCSTANNPKRLISKMKSVDRSKPLNISTVIVIVHYHEVKYNTAIGTLIQILGLPSIKRAQFNFI